MTFKQQHDDAERTLASLRRQLASKNNQGELALRTIAAQQEAESIRRQLRVLGVEPEA